MNRFLRNMVLGLAIVCAGEVCMGQVADDPSPGMWAKLYTQDASGVAAVDFTTLATIYRDFKIVGSNVVPATDNVQLFTRISVAAAFKTGGADYHWTDAYYYSAGQGYGGGSDAGIRIFLGAGSEAGESLSFEVVFFDPADTTNRTQVMGVSGGQNNGGFYVSRNFLGGYIAATSAIDGIRFYFDSGNIESGTFTLYGRCN